MCVQLLPCAHFPLTTGVPCPYSKKEGGSPVARTTADLYKLVRVGGTVLCRECSCLGFRSHPFSAARPTHYRADKMPSQLKQNKPGDLSGSSLCMKSYIKMTADYFDDQNGIRSRSPTLYWYWVDTTMYVLLRKPCFVLPQHSTVKLLHQSLLPIPRR